MTTPKLKKKLKTLFQYQADAYEWARHVLEQGYRCINIIGRMGCGKTTITTALGAALVEDGYKTEHGRVEIKGVIVVAPLTQIVSGFASERKITIPPGVRDGKVVDLEDQWLSNPNEHAFKEFWEETKHAKPMVVMTYQAFYRRFMHCAQDLAGYVLVLDEAHHAPLAAGKKNTSIGWHRDEWTRRGGIVIQTTATPWHTESGMMVYEKHDPVYNISNASLAERGIGPETFEVRRVELPYEAKTIKEWLFKGDVNIKALVKTYKDSLTAEWVRMRKPITLVRPPENVHIEPLTQAFKVEGAKVFDATGASIPKKEGEKLKNERELTNYLKRQIDVLLASRRFDEGSDLPSLSTCFYLGSPTSIRHLLQVFGRTMHGNKEKIKGYPKTYKKKSVLVLFVPKIDPELLDDYIHSHYRSIVTIAAYLADYEVAHEVRNDLDALLRASLVWNEKSAKKRVKKDTLLQQFIWTTHEAAEAREVLFDITTKVAAERGEMMTSINRAAVARHISEIEDPNLRIRVFTTLGIQEHASASEILDRIVSTMKTVIQKSTEKDRDRQKAEDEVRKGVDEIISEIADDWSGLTSVSVSKGMMRMISKLTGRNANKIASQIRKRCHPYPLSTEVARAVVRRINRLGSYPTASSKSTAKDGLPGYTWGQIAHNWNKFNLEGESLEHYGRTLQDMLAYR